MKSKKKFKIAVFLDGRPGHEKQTLGIVEQLQKQVEVELRSCSVEKPSPVSQLSTLLVYICGGRREIDCQVADVNLAIGTGTHTHLPMLFAKKRYNFPVITCMTPASYLLGEFDLIFSPHHDNVGEGANVVKTVGPPNTSINKERHENNVVLILIGGSDPKSHRWESSKIIQAVEALISYDKEKSFVISSSPRTPEETEQSFLQLSQLHKNVSFNRFKDTPKGWVEREYARCKYVWVTGDSISMVYEALSSGCRVGIIPVAWKSKNSKFQRSERYLHENKLTVELDSYLNGYAYWDTSKSLNEAKRCADEILRRWG